jgi:hypothetical protein
MVEGTVPKTGIIPGVINPSNLGDRITAIGPWQSESTEELIAILHSGRDERGRKPPDLL